MKRFLLLTLACILFASSVSFAQERTITGKVTSSDDGSALPGVNVVLKGTATGTATDSEGRFSLSVPASGGSLVFSFIGLQTQEIPIGDRSVIDVSLSLDATQLSEIVVTGVAAGTSVKKLGFSIGKVDEAMLKEVPATDPGNALRGKVSGVQVVQPSGIPGTAPVIRLRGSSVINSTSGGPLIIVDGIITANSLADINMNDVESIEVIKGAAGAALYGSQAGNGVVQIITKKGSGEIGVTRVTARNEFGFTNLQREFPLSNSHFYQLDANGDFILSDQNDPTTRLEDADAVMDNPYPRLFNQQQELFLNRFFMNNVVQLAASSKNTNFYASFDNLQNESVVEGLPSYDRKTVRANVDHTINKFKFSTNLSYSKSTGPDATERAQGGAFYGVLLVEPDLDLRTPANDGQKYSAGLRFNGNGTNPLYEANNTNWVIERDRFLGNFTASYQLTNDLRIEGQYSLDQLFRYERFFQPVDFLTPSNPDGTGGSLFMGRSVSSGSVATATAYYTKKFTDVNFGATLRYQLENYKTDGYSLNGSQFVVKGVPQFQALDRTTLSSNSSQTEIISENIFLNLSGDYKEKYILEALIRRDGSSLFGEDVRYQTFGRVTSAYRITEDFKINGIQEWKIRASYGISGERPGFSWQYETFNLVGGTAQKGTFGNADLRPTKIAELELGTNIGFLNRFTFEFNYSRTEATDQIFNVPLSPATGWSSQFRNAGTVETTNIEMALGADIFTKPDFTWNVNVVASRYKSVITELGVPEFNAGGSTTAGMFRIKQGGEFGDMWGQQHFTSLSQMITDENGDVTNIAGYVLGGGSNLQLDDFVVNQHGYVVRADRLGQPNENAVLVYDPATGQALDSKIGTSIPDLILGVSSTMTYKNFSLYFLVDSQIGGDVYNATKQLLYFNERHADLDQAGAPTGEGTAYNFWASATSLYNGNNPTKHFVEDASYVKIREINISYNLGRGVMEKLGIGNVIHDARISLIGRNLFTFTNYSGYDPEVALGVNSTNYRVDSFTHPLFRTFSASLQLRF